jgi:hypothetical protein
MFRFLPVLLGCLSVFPANDGWLLADEPSRTESARPADRRSTPVRTGETLYDWKWLATRFDRNDDAAVIREELAARPEIFEPLDRNWDGRLTRDDFDWSDSSPLGWQQQTNFAFFKVVDLSGDGRISQEEWQEAFAMTAGEKGFLDDSDLKRFIFQPRVLKEQRQSQKRADRGVRDKSLPPPPELGQMAPDFELHSADGRTSLKLSSLRGNKPVVLIFGSFT